MAEAAAAASVCGVRVTEIRVSNFRSLVDVAVQLDDLTILVGANNAGKTSFLDAMYAAVGAGRRLLGVDDIHVAGEEAIAPQDRTVTIDILLRPVGMDGKTLDVFPHGSFWTNLWGTGINQDMEFHDFMAFRTTLAWSEQKGDYVLDRRFLKDWAQAGAWLTSEQSADHVGADQVEPIALHYIDAKRDLEDDLRRQGSFWRRLTDNLGLQNEEIEAFENVLTDLNKNIVEKSQVLQHLKDSLASVSTVVSADSGGVEITPVARRLRDLSKGVDVTFTSGTQAFPLARHGMGTRSLASLLVFRAFMSWRYGLAQKHDDLTHALLALEEPESHLHPQAQRALFAQIKLIPGQRIVSTHSPYFAGQARLGELRLFTKHKGVTRVERLDLSKLKPDDIRKLERSVIASRGDLLFARALVLFEGETEEQALPLWAQAYWGASTHELGFSFVAVDGGNNYFPFIWLAQSFGIPWYVFSDGEDKPVASLAGDATRAGIPDIWKADNIIVIPNKLDLEAHLMQAGYFDAFESAIKTMAGEGALDNYCATLNGKPGKTIDGTATIRDYNGEAGRQRAALDMVSDKKTRYAAPLATAILALEDPNRRVPGRIADLFKIIGKRFNLAPQKADLMGKTEGEEA